MNNIHGSQAVSIKYVIWHNWELRRKNVIFVTMENLDIKNPIKNAFYVYFYV